MLKKYIQTSLALCLCATLLVGCAAQDKSPEPTATTVSSLKDDINFEYENKYILNAGADVKSLLKQVKATDSHGKRLEVNLKNPKAALPTPGKTGVIAVYAEDEDGHRKEIVLEVEVKDEKDSKNEDDKKDDSKDTAKDTKSVTKETKQVSTKQISKNTDKKETKQEEKKQPEKTPEPTKKPEEKKDTQTTVSKEERLRKAQEQVDKGSLGFFEENGSTQAVQIIRDAQAISSTTQLGAYGDATSLENMKKVFQYMNTSNYYRSIDPNNYGENKYALMVTDELMALTQVQANHSYNVVEHWNALKGKDKYNYVAENISWGYNDANDGWYTEEKANYEAYMAAHPNATQDDIEAWNAANLQAGDADHQVGHYLTLCNPFNAFERRVNAFGYAIVTKPGTYGKVEHCSNYSNTGWGLGPNYPSIGTPYSVTEYQARFMNYYNRVMTELNEAKRALGKY